jgi:hypothetical protein
VGSAQGCAANNGEVNMMDFQRIFGASGPGAELRAYLAAQRKRYGLRSFRKDRDADDGRDDDRRRSVNFDDLSDDEIEQLADRLGDGNDDEDEIEKQKHQISALADLLSEATGGQWSRPYALHHLMTTAQGAAMVRRLRKAIDKRKDKKCRATPSMTSRWS